MLLAKVFQPALVSIQKGVINVTFIHISSFHVKLWNVLWKSVLAHLNLWPFSIYFRDYIKWKKTLIG